MIFANAQLGSINFDEIISKKIYENVSQVLYIVPTKRNKRFLKKHILLNSPQEAFSNIHIETIETLVLSILQAGGYKRKEVLSAPAAAVILELSIKDINFEYFSKDDLTLGTLEKIQSVITEYKRNGFTPDNLLLEVNKIPVGLEFDKNSDIHKIYSAYQKKCEQLNIKEVGDIYNDFLKIPSDELEARVNKIFTGVEFVCVSGFDEFTTPEVTILKRFSDAIKKEMVINFDYYKYNNHIFSHLDDCYERLTRIGFHEVEDLSPDLSTPFKKYFRENFFKTKRLYNKNYELKKYKVLKNSITKISAVNRYKEVEAIAKEIKNLVLNDENISPSNICILFNKIENYADIIRDVFNSYNIPYNLTDRFYLKTSPVILGILNFLEILERNFYYRDIFRALSNKVFYDDNINVNDLKKAAFKGNIISGYNNWLSEIDELLKTETVNSVDYNSYHSAKQSIIRINELLAPFNKELSIDEFLNTFMNFIKKSNITYKIINNTGDRVNEAVKALDMFIDTINEVFALLKEEHKNSKLKLSYFINVIRTSINSIRYNVKEIPGYGVQVTTLREVRNLKFDYMFIGGLTDKDLPAQYKQDIFMYNEFSEKTFNNKIVEDRYRFYQALSAWGNKKLYLSVPQKDNKTSLTESIFLTEFCYLYDVNIKTQQDYSSLYYSFEECIANYRYLSDEDKERLEIAQEKIINDAFEERSNYLEEQNHYTGNLVNVLEGDDEAASKILGLRERKYSVSALETYLSCPYKYYLNKVLYVEEEAEMDEEIDSRVKGNVFHKIFERFYKEIGFTLSNCSEENAAKARTLIIKIANEELVNFNKNSAEYVVLHQQLFGSGDGDIEKSTLLKFIDLERGELNYVPKYFEYEFGFDKDLEIDGIKVRGKVDRIDIDAVNNKFRVVDYKTGLTSLSKAIDNQKHIQLPVYTYIIKILLQKEYPGITNDNPIVYSLVYGKVERKVYKKMLLPEVAMMLLKESVEGISKGDFSITTDPKRDLISCKYCKYRDICRVNELPAPRIETVEKE